MMDKKSIKILLLGDSGVGKTAILYRLTDDVFNPTFITTIGIDFKITSIKIGGKEVKLQIWDTAGQERFHTLTSAYYRNADGVMLVYDVTNSQSLENVSKWLCNIEENATDTIEKMLVANKCDLIDRRLISASQVQAHALENDIDFMETSAKNGLNISELFEKIVERIIAKVRHGLPIDYSVVFE